MEELPGRVKKEMGKGLRGSRLGEPKKWELGERGTEPKKFPGFSQFRGQDPRGRQMFIYS